MYWTMSRSYLPESHLVSTLVTRGKKVSTNINHMEGWTCKVWKQRGDENTGRLPYYRKIVVNRDRKTTLHLLHITVQGNRCKVVFSSFFFFTIFPQQASLLVFSSLPCFCTSYQSILIHVVNFHRKNFTPSFCCFFLLPDTTLVAVHQCMHVH